MKRLVGTAFASVSLVACGHQAPVPEATVPSFHSPEVQAQLAQAQAALEQAPHVQQMLTKLGVSSLSELEDNVMYFPTPQGIKTLRLNPVDDHLAPQQLSGGIGQSTVQETVNGVVGGRFDAYSKSTLACNSFFPLPTGVNATVLHSVAMVSPNNRTFGPFTSGTGRSGSGYAVSPQDFMGGNTSATGTYVFSYSIEGSCDGYGGYGKTASAWFYNGRTVERINTPVVSPQ